MRVKELEFTQGIIGGDMMRDLIDVFPELEDAFIQIRDYDEYRTPTQARVLVTLPKLTSLVEVYQFEVTFRGEEIIINID